jgi:FkbM family methyltransferase
MNKLIHRVAGKLGFKITNVSKKEKDIKDLIHSLSIIEDKNDLVYNSASYIFLLKKYFPELTIDSTRDGVLVCFNDLKFYVESSEEFFILKEVFIEKDYNLLTNENIVIFDIGMNIGISSLFFALNNNVTKMYSFEPVTETYQQAVFNLELNPRFSNKIEAFNYGLGGSTRVEKVLFNSQAKGNCGIRLDLSLVVNKENAQEIEINIKSIGEILPDLFAKHPNQKKVLKIDCEGAEYEILEKLNQIKLLDEIDVLLIEWHDKGSEILEKLLVANNFRIISRYLTSITGMIYAFKK